MEFGELLKQLRQEAKLSREDMAEKLSLSYWALAKYENGERKPDYETLHHLADFFHVSIDFLLGRTDKRNPEDVNNFSLPVGETINLPVLYNIHGGEQLLSRESVIGYEPTPLEDVEGTECFWLQVTGDAMTGSRIYDGDLVLIRRQEKVKNGEIAVVSINGGNAIIRKFFREGNRIMLKPTNTSYEPLIFENEAISNIVIIGRVIQLRVKF